MVCFAEALEMNDFALPQKTNDIVDIRVIGQAKNIVVGEPGFLLWCDLARTTFVRLVAFTATEHILQD